MKCPKKLKHCKPSICFRASKTNYICSGIAKYPNKSKDDVVWLCLRGKYSKTNLEMTVSEAWRIISTLTASLADTLRERRK